MVEKKQCRLSVEDAAEQGVARSPSTDSLVARTAPRTAAGPAARSSDLSQFDIDYLADALASLLRAVPAASQLLTKSQAATMLGVGRTRTLQRLIDTGALRTVKLGTRARIPLAEVERFLVEGEQPVPSPPPTARPTRRPVVRHLPGPGNLADQLAEVRGMRI